MKSYVFYNPASGRSAAAREELAKKLTDAEWISVAERKNYADYIREMDSADRIYILGGDGTLMRFASETADVKYENDIYYLPCGTGNDFYRDVAELEGRSTCEVTPSTEPLKVNKYLKDLPEVTVNGETYRFINGVGFGIDGYCCEEGDKKKAASDKPVNYTAIAIKGLLFDYKPCGATVTVDGVSHRYDKVWIAPTMNGRFYGGGMNAAPEQDRMSEDGKLTVVLFHDSSKLGTLMVFPKIFTGDHVKSTKVVALHTGYDVTVEFDEPRPLQIDGETFVGVKSYSARSKKHSTVAK